jgi:hypothetical protein
MLYEKVVEKRLLLLVVNWHTNEILSTDYYKDGILNADRTGHLIK